MPSVGDSRCFGEAAVRGDALPPPLKDPKDGENALVDGEDGTMPKALIAGGRWGGMDREGMLLHDAVAHELSSVSMLSDMECKGVVGMAGTKLVGSDCVCSGENKYAMMLDGTTTSGAEVSCHARSKSESRSNHER